MGAGDDGDEDECYHRGAFRTGRSISSDMAGPSGISGTRTHYLFITFKQKN